MTERILRITGDRAKSYILTATLWVDGRQVRLYKPKPNSLTVRAFCLLATEDEEGTCPWLSVHDTANALLGPDATHREIVKQASAINSSFAQLLRDWPLLEKRGGDYAKERVEYRIKARVIWEAL